MKIIENTLFEHIKEAIKPPIYYDLRTACAITDSVIGRKYNYIHICRRHQHNYTVDEYYPYPSGLCSPGLDIDLEEDMVVFACVGEGIEQIIRIDIDGWSIPLADPLLLEKIEQSINSLFKTEIKL